MADAIVRTQAMFASTIAEYYVEEDRIRLELEIGAADLEAFRNLLPDEIYQKLGHPSRDVPVAGTVKTESADVQLLGPLLPDGVVPQSIGHRLVEAGLKGGHQWDFGQPLAQ